MVIAEVVLEEDAIPTPLGPKATEYLSEFGLDSHVISRENVNSEGYSEFELTEDGKRAYRFGAVVTERKPWPEGFSWFKFLEIAFSEG